MRRSPAVCMLSSRLSTRFYLCLIICLIAASSLAAQQAPVLVTQKVDNSVRTTLTGNVHPLARAQYDQGEAPADMVLHRMLLVLKRSDQQEKALRSLIENQQNKKSSSYHKWLTPAEFGSQFGLADSDMAAVTNWLQQSGFQVDQITTGRDVIEFTGTAGQVKQAFGTAIHKYVIKGEEHLANVADPSIPKALTPVIAGVDSLHNFLKKAQNTFAGKYSLQSKQLTSQPDYTFAGCGGTCYAVTPFDFATIYNLSPLWSGSPAIDGTGQTIAIVGRTDINPADAPAFWSLFGLGKNSVPEPTLNIIYNGPNPGINGDEAEADIDTQWSGAAAPGATIDFVTSESTETDDGVDLSALYIVDNNLAPIMSESYGSCEAAIGSGGVDFYGTMWEQAAAQGITVLLSTGDNGAAGCDDPNTESAAQDGLNVSGLASTPYNVAVGGTDFNQYNKWSTYWKPSSGNNAVTQESAISYIPETTWNDSCTNLLLDQIGGSSNPETNCNNASFSSFLDISGGSGGASVAWLKPTWQTGAGVPNDNARDMPDVSLFASNGFLNSFYLICQSDASPSGSCDITNPGSDLQGYGGTSVASPAFAGIMALVVQKWGIQGNANLVLYNLATKQPTAFHDVPAGSTNSVPCFTGTPDCVTNVGSDAYGILSGYSTTANYDLATGLGSVNAQNLVNDWSDVTFTPTTTTLSLSTATITHGTAVNVTVNVASSSATGDVSLLVAPGTPGHPSIDWASLTNGTVTWPTNLLPGGNYQVIAHYSGDTTYGGSYSSPSSSITVNPENSSIYLPGVVTPSGVASSVVYGTGDAVQYLLRADVQNSQGNFCTTEVGGEIACPTGTITFADNGSPLDGGTFKLNSEGYTEDQSIQLTGGSHTLVANYEGDPSYKSSSATTTVTVTKATTSISNVASSSLAVNTGQQFTVTATVATSSYGAAPTGTVTFLANGTPLTGTVQLSPTSGNANTGVVASVAASLTTSISTGGSFTITATYAGDGNYASTTSTNSVVVVVTSTAAFTLAANPASLAITPGGAAGSSTITVTDVGGFNGSVSLAASGLPAGVTATFSPTSTTANSTLSLTANGSATPGTAAVTITGTSGSLTATTSVALTVSQDFTLSAPTPPPAVLSGESTTSTFNVTAKNGTTFANPVTFACNGLPDATVSCSFSSIAQGATSPQPVTVTIKTTGPNTAGAVRNERRRADNRSPWLPLSLPLAGIVMAGFAGRKVSKYGMIVALCATLLLIGLLVACGSSSSPGVGVSVSPSASTLFPNDTTDNWPPQTATFTATVTNNSNTAVTWAVSPSTAGTITAGGVYTAPTISTGLPTSATITATSQGDTTKSATATVTITPSTVPGAYPLTVTATEGSVAHNTASFTLTAQ